MNETIRINIGRLSQSDGVDDSGKYHTLELD